MKATIYDVAREAGVSIAAVSQVINRKGKISEDRRGEIMRVMERLNFQPSVIAAALTGKKTYTLGLIVPDISNPFFAEIARAVEDQGHQMGYSLVICSTYNKDDRLERYLNLLQQQRVDGVIIGTGMENKEMLIPFIQKGTPTAMIAREIQGLNELTVITDDFAGGSLAADHLLRLGHTRVAVLSEHPTVRSSQERVRGIRETLAKAGIRLADGMVKATGSDPLIDGKQKARELLTGEGRPTAIFCGNDLLAIGAMQAAKELNINVPGELSVVGFDNTIIATVTSPPLTTIAQPMQSMGKMVVELLIQQLKKEPPGKQRIVLPPELIIRDSTSVPKI